MTIPHAYPPMMAAFRRMLRERRKFRPGSRDWQWRTSAARKMFWHMRGVPVAEWRDA